MSKIKRDEEEYNREMKAWQAGLRLAPPGKYIRRTSEQKKIDDKKEKKQKMTETRKRSLTYHEGKFIEGKSKGLNDKDAAIFAGYAPLSASVQASRLMRKEKIIMELDKVGLSDKVLAENIKANMVAGAGIKATADTSLKATELALKLKGHLQAEERGGDLTQNNIYINELKQMDDDSLLERLKELQKSLK